MVSTPLTEKDRAQIKALHTAGFGRNDIADKIGRSGSTVTKIAQELGLSFDRSSTAAATEAKIADAKAKRAALAVKLLDDAERLREQLFTGCTVHSFGGRENTYAEQWISEPTFSDKRNIIQAASTAISTSLRLDLHDGDTSNETVGSLLGSLFDSIQAKHVESSDSDGD